MFKLELDAQLTSQCFAVFVTSFCYHFRSKWCEHEDKWRSFKHFTERDRWSFWFLLTAAADNVRRWPQSRLYERIIVKTVLSVKGGRLIWKRIAGQAIATAAAVGPNFPCMAIISYILLPSKMVCKPKKIMVMLRFRSFACIAAESNKYFLNQWINLSKCVRCSTKIEF